MSLGALYQQQQFGSYIDGAFLIHKSQPLLSLVSPVTQKPWKELSLASTALTNQAIQAAHTALPIWKSVPAPQRGKILRQIGNLLIENKTIFAECMAMEMGKPIQEGAKEIDYSAGYFFWFAGEAERLYGKIVPASIPEKQLMVIHEPVGVCGIITPWNFPLAMGARKISAALAAGCTIVAKPSPECPITMCLFAQVCQEALLPKGVFNMVMGPEKEIGQAILSAPEVRKISFTGSCDVGRYLYKESAPTLKKLTLELGGQAPLIVFDDADLNKAISGTLTAKFRNNGQTCIAANRALIQKSIYPAYIAGLKAAVEKLVVGSPLEAKTEISNILHPLSTARVKEHVRDAINKGAEVILQGKKPYHPTLLTHITQKMRIFHEETFGPVLGITVFDSDEEGFALANDCEYGLAAYAFTSNLKRSRDCMQRLEYGIIGINDGLPSTPQASFGGLKNSGFGREGGPSAIQEYLVEKYISIAF